MIRPERRVKPTSRHGLHGSVERARKVFFLGFWSLEMLSDSLGPLVHSCLDGLFAWTLKQAASSSSVLEAAAGGKNTRVDSSGRRAIIIPSIQSLHQAGAVFVMLPFG